VTPATVPNRTACRDDEKLVRLVALVKNRLTARPAIAEVGQTTDAVSIFRLLSSRPVIAAFKRQADARVSGAQPRFRHEIRWA
jgi:hypothetical protein